MLELIDIATELRRRFAAKARDDQERREQAWKAGLKKARALRREAQAPARRQACIEKCAHTKAATEKRRKHLKQLEDWMRME